MQSCRQTRWWVDDCRLVQNWIHFLVIRPCAQWLGLGSHTNYMIFQMNNHLKAMRPWWLIPHWINPSYICWTPFQHKLNFHEPVRYRINKAASVASCSITQSETARATVALGSLAPSIGTTSRFPGTSVDHDNDNLWFFHNKHNPSVIVRLQQETSQNRMAKINEDLHHGTGTAVLMQNFSILVVIQLRFI